MSAKDEGLWLFGYGSLIWKPNFPFKEARVASIRGYKRRFWQGSTDHRGVPGAPGRVVTLIPIVPSKSAFSSASAVAPPSTSATSIAVSITSPSQPQAQAAHAAADSDTEQDSNAEHGVCYGMCYYIEASEREKVLQYLDVREQGGYTQAMVPVYFHSGVSSAASASSSSASASTATASISSSSSNSVSASPLPSAAAASDFKASAAEPSVKALIYLATSSNEEYLGPAPMAVMAQQIASSVGPSGPNYEYLYRLAAALREMGVVDPHVNELERRVKALRESSASASATSASAASNSVLPPASTSPASNAAAAPSTPQPTTSGAAASVATSN